MTKDELLRFVADAYPQCHEEDETGEEHFNLTKFRDLLWEWMKERSKERKAK